jgi:hypothetical protein
MHAVFVRTDVTRDRKEDGGPVGIERQVIMLCRISGHRSWGLGQRWMTRGSRFWEWLSDHPGVVTEAASHSDLLALR